jgi:hypothetical protein
MELYCQGIPVMCSQMLVVLEFSCKSHCWLWEIKCVELYCSVWSGYLSNLYSDASSIGMLSCKNHSRLDRSHGSTLGLYYSLRKFIMYMCNR